MALGIATKTAEYAVQQTFQSVNVLTQFHLVLDGEFCAASDTGVGINRGELGQAVRAHNSIVSWSVRWNLRQPVVKLTSLLDNYSIQN